MDKFNFTFWEDKENDCWVAELPNGEIVDFSFIDGCGDVVNNYLENNI